jgi:hypothetical protein
MSASTYCSFVYRVKVAHSSDAHTRGGIPLGNDNRQLSEKNKDRLVHKAATNVSEEQTASIFTEVR